MDNPNCVLHEDKLNSLEKNIAIIGTQLTQLLERDGDFLVKVINGVTTERLASELLAEMYLGMKELRAKMQQEISDLKKASPKNMWSNFGNAILPLLNLLTIIGLIITMYAVFNK